MSLVVAGIAIGVAAKFISALGLVLQKKAHVRESSKKTKLQRPYSRNPTWIFAFLTYTFGNLITMAALALAPASIVASLDSLVLVFSVGFSALILHEKAKKRDILAVFVILLGVIGIALGGPRGEILISGPETLIELLGELPFVVYASLVGGILLLLMAFANFLSSSANCCPTSLNAVAHGIIPAILSAFLTQLSKIFGELISAASSGANVFGSFEIYVFLIILIIFNVLQVHQLQRALARFSALTIIPVFQVSLMLLAVLGGGIYFQEFSSFSFAPVHEPTIFALGLLLTVGGVVILSIREATTMEKFARVRRRLKFLIRTQIAMKKHHHHQHHRHPRRHSHRRHGENDEASSSSSSSSSSDEGDGADREEQQRQLAANRACTLPMGSSWGPVACALRAVHRHDQGSSPTIETDRQKEAGSDPEPRTSSTGSRARRRSSRVRSRSGSTVGSRTGSRVDRRPVDGPVSAAERQSQLLSPPEPHSRHRRHSVGGGGPRSPATIVNKKQRPQSTFVPSSRPQLTPTGSSGTDKQSVTKPRSLSVHIESNIESSSMNLNKTQ